jgi:hypothetical protein
MWNNYPELVDPEGKYESANDFVRHEGLSCYELAFRHGFIRGGINKIGKRVYVQGPGIADSDDTYLIRRILRTIERDRPGLLDVVNKVQVESAEPGSKRISDITSYTNDVNIEGEVEQYFHEQTPGAQWIDNIYDNMGIRSAMLKSEAKLTLEMVTQKYGDDPDHVAIDTDDKTGRTDVYVNSENGSVRFTFLYGVSHSFGDEPAVDAIMDSGQNLQEWHQGGERHREDMQPARIVSVYGEPMTKEFWHNGRLEDKWSVNEDGEWESEFIENEQVNDEMNNLSGESDDVDEFEMSNADKDFLRDMGISARMDTEMVKFALTLQ